MKILVVGAGGTIGSAIVTELSSRHQIITAGRSTGDFTVDLADEQSIANMYKQIKQKIGFIDAVASAAGSGYFAPMAKLTPENFKSGLNEKMLGQINLVLLGQNILNDRGSFTLISGILNDEPIIAGLNSSTINAAIDGFVKAAAIELPRNIRINSVNPTVVTESLHVYGEYFRGFISTSAKNVALTFSKSIEGAQTGQVYKLR